VRLPHQALIIALAAGCACTSGCARLLGAMLAPQEAGMATANAVANSASAPAQNSLGGVSSEVDRFLSGEVANKAELQRIKEDLGNRMRNEGRGSAAQDEPDRLRPWHPRAPPIDPMLRRTAVVDTMTVGHQPKERGLAASGRLPDGIAPGELRPPMDLDRIRLERRP